MDPSTDTFLEAGNDLSLFTFSYSCELTAVVWYYAELAKKIVIYVFCAISFPVWHSHYFLCQLTSEMNRLGEL